MPKIEFHCPRCGSQIQVEKKSAGLTAPCPRCSEWIRVPEESIQPSPDPAPEMKLKEPAGGAPAPSPSTTHYAEPSPAPHHGAALGGWSCLLISLVLMFLEWDLWFVFAPLLVVALILGVVAMARGHILSGQTLLVATLLLPVLVAVKYHNKDIDSWWTRPAEPSSVAATADAGVSPEAPAVAEPTADPVPAEPPAPGPRPIDKPAIEPVEAAARPVESDWGDEVEEPAPDWNERYDYWFEQYGNRFVQPRVGLYVKVQMKEGRSYEGTLRNVDAEALTLQIPNGQLRLEKARLTEESRRRFFQIDFAKFHANRKVDEEREAYDPGQ